MTEQPRYKVQAVEPGRSGTTGEALDLLAALEAAWRLNRHLEADVEVLDRKDGGKVAVTVRVEWAD